MGFRCAFLRDFALLSGVRASRRAWLVTGNLKHYPETGRVGVTVISPGEYLEGLEEK